MLAHWHARLLVPPLGEGVVLEVGPYHARRVDLLRPAIAAGPGMSGSQYAIVDDGGATGAFGPLRSHDTRRGVEGVGHDDTSIARRPPGQPHRYGKEPF